MSLVRWRPSHDLPMFPSDVLNIQREINRMFNEMFRSDWGEDSALAPSLWSPATDITEREDAYVVKLELPGVSKRDVTISLRGHTLTVRGDKKQEKESEESNYRRVERSYGSFERSFTLPDSAAADRVEASFVDGILMITVPKAGEAQAKQIEVHVK